MARYLPNRFSLLLLLAVLVAAVLPVRDAAAEWLALVQKGAVALVFFMHGAKLSREVVIAGFVNWRLQLLCLGVTFALFPLVGLLLASIVGGSLAAPLVLGILYICVLPSTIQSAIALTAVAHGNVAAAVCAATVSNILGMLLAPLLLALLAGAGGEAEFSLGMIGKILLQLMLPFVAGQVLQPWIGGWLRRHKPLGTAVDQGTILLVVYLAFSAAVVDGLWRQFEPSDLAEVVAACAVLLVAALVVTLGAGRWLGLPREDRAAALFAGSTKSLASGVPMAGVLFAGQDNIGGVLLPLMLYHQIQLIACAVIAERMGTTTQAAARV